jgi:hypothetical protein
VSQPNRFELIFFAEGEVTRSEKEEDVSPDAVLPPE